MLEINGNIILTPIYQIILDLQAELRYNGSNLLHTVKPPRGNGDIIVSCPVHHNGMEQHPSASITTKEKHKKDKVVPSGFLYCFSCKTKMSLDNLISYCFGKRDKGEFGRKWILDHYANFEIETRQSCFNKLKEHTEEPKPMYISEEELEKYRFIHPYMYKRGLTDDLIERYDIGYQKDFKLTKDSKPFECITFPVRDINGNTLFIARRGIKHKIYHYMENTEKPLYGLYEANKYHKNADTLYICESMLNAITLEKILNVPAIALLGTGSSDQYAILKNLPYRHYVLCLDNDKPGCLGVSKLIKALRNTHILTVYKIKEEGKDINDLVTLERDEFMKQVDIMTKEEFLKWLKSRQE